MHTNRQSIFSRGSFLFRKIGSKIFATKKVSGSIRKFSFPIDQDVRKNISDSYRFTGDLLDIFTRESETAIHKWHHYLPIYDRYFSGYRGKSVKFLEIGVANGGSMRLWREYFGEKAVIFGIDIDPKCLQYDGSHGQVRIGSQVDSEFLRTVITEMGGVDVVLDDGSHQMDHVVETLKIVFPKLNDAGTYMIEDLHTSYWPRFGGGYNSAKNFFNVVRSIADDIHHWYHDRPANFQELVGCQCL